MSLSAQYQNQVLPKNRYFRCLKSQKVKNKKKKTWRMRNSVVKRKNMVAKKQPYLVTKCFFQNQPQRETK